MLKRALIATSYIIISLNIRSCLSSGLVSDTVSFDWFASTEILYAPLSSMFIFSLAVSSFSIGIENTMGNPFFDLFKYWPKHSKKKI